MNYDYFDADYFQNGHSKGTVYNNYLEVARSSEIYREISHLIGEVFKPRRTLEIGCATGIIVKHLNKKGIEAHGIDVSDWAISNREHGNVVLAGAESLPFPDCYFDFIYSVHALEHIPVALKDSAFAELKRVSGSAIHLHMMPIVGEGPYSGEREAVRSNLRKDPTHNLLEDIYWWRKEFGRIGFSSLNTAVLFAHESGAVDLGVSQILNSNYDVGSDVFDRIRVWNANVVNEVRSNFHTARQGSYIPPNSPWSEIKLEATGKWSDVIFEPSNIIMGNNSVVTAKISNLGSEIIPLRFCFITEDGAEADFWREFPPGTSIFSFKQSDLSPRIGIIDRSPVRQIYFGGVTSSDFTVAISIMDQDRPLFSS